MVLVSATRGREPLEWRLMQMLNLHPVCLRLFVACAFGVVSKFSVTKFLPCGVRILLAEASVWVLDPI